MNGTVRLSPISVEFEYASKIVSFLPAIDPAASVNVIKFDGGPYQIEVNSVCVPSAPDSALRLAKDCVFVETSMNVIQLRAELTCGDQAG